MNPVTLLLQIFVGCVAAYFFFNVARAILAIVRPKELAPIDLAPIDTAHGRLTINPDERTEDWILEGNSDPFRIHVLGTPPDTDLLKFLDPILSHKCKIVEHVESHGESLVGAELLLLYVRKGTCYFDINIADREIPMGYNEAKGVYAL